MQKLTVSGCNLLNHRRTRTCLMTSNVQNAEISTLNSSLAREQEGEVLSMELASLASRVKRA